MAKSLAELVGKNKGLIKGPGGVLTEETPDLQELTGQAGLAAAPTLAIGGGLIGATPQQQKMIGTPAQTQAALRMSMDGTETLQEARRRGQVRTTASEDEKARMEKAKALEGLSAAEKKTQELIGRETAKLAAPEQAPKLSAEQMLVAAPPQGVTVPAEAYAQARPIMARVLSAIQAGTEPSQADIAEINKAFGRPIDNLVDKTFLEQFLVNSADAIKQQGAQAVRDNLTVADLLNEPDFGYTSQQLAGLLGVDEQTLLGTTVGDLDNLINAAQAKDFSQVAQTQAAMQSGTLGQAEMQAARGSLREAEAVGIAATEADFQNLEDAIARADVITFAGKQMTVEAALEDDNIEKFITDYLNGDDAKKKEMEAQEPSLVQFVKNNQAVFLEAAKGLETATGKFKTTQEANLAYAQAFPEQLLTSILPDWQKPSATSLKEQLQYIPLFGYYEKLTDQQKKQVSENLSRAVNSYPELSEELAGLSAEQIQRLNLDKAGTKTLDEYIAGKKRYQAISQIDPDNVDAIVQQLAGGDEDAAGLTAGKLQSLLDQNARLKYLGYGGADLSMFDRNKDGKLDSPDVLLQTLLNKSSAAGLGAFLSNPSSLQMPNASLELPAGGQALATLADKLSKEFSDNVLTKDEIVNNKNLTLEDIEMLTGTEEFKNLPVAVRTGLARKADVLRASTFDNDMRTIFGDQADIYDNPAMKAQIANPEIYRKDISKAGWGALTANIQSKTAMLDQLNGVIKQQEKLPFPKIDVAGMKRYRDALQAMIYMSWDRANALKAEEEAAVAAQQIADINQMAVSFVGPAEAMQADETAKKQADGTDASGRLYRTSLLGERQYYNFSKHKWEPA